MISLALATVVGAQLSISRVELLPDRPTPYLLRDWSRTAREFDRAVFDEGARGTYLPLVWRVSGVPNLDVPGFGMPSYVGKEEMRGRPAEAVTALGALLGATAVGIDKRRWVELTPQYLNAAEGTILNNVGGRSGSSFWYELLPSITFVQLASRYPDWTRGADISKGIADAWIRGVDTLEGDFDHTSFDFAGRKAVDNGQWKEPDAAAGVAYLQLFEGLRSADEKYLGAARRALTALDTRETNPTYEILTAYGALAAAYLNAERGERWNVPRLVDWCFDPTSPHRAGWGMVAGRWGDYDVGGLMGSTSDGGGYPFAMNTFLNAATLAPVARYDDRFSAALAKWVLNLANASRLFYRDGLPKTHQSSAEWPGDSGNGIPYEALRRSWEGKSPYATGDAKRNGWAKEDLGLYGGGYVGLLGALVRPTNVPMVLQIDLRATDFLPTKAYPTDLLWNAHDAAKVVEFDLGSTPVRPYDAVSNRFLSLKPVRGVYKVRLAPKQAVQVVRVPARGSVAYSRNRTIVEGVPIDFNNGRVPLPPRVARPRRDESVSVDVARAGKDGTVDWSKSGAIQLSGGTMRADLRFAWNDRTLYFRLDQRASSTETVEAPSADELRKHWWDFESVGLNLDLGREALAVASVPEVTVGWSSIKAKGLVFSPDLAGVQTETSGTAGAADRVIQGRIAWTDFIKAVGTRKPFRELIKRGTKIGCQPLLVDGSWRRQAYLNGKQYLRPSGFDRDSRTLVLR